MMQNYHAVGNRCAVNLQSLELPCRDEAAIRVLEKQGYTVVSVSLTVLARKLVGEARYKRNCLPKEAPECVDCSSLTKWLYGQKGIWLPRHPIDQRDAYSTVRRKEDTLAEGDLVFTVGARNYYWDNPADGVGHVGMVTSDRSLIHAANAKDGVVEVPLGECLFKWEDRGAVRIIENPERTFTFECPAGKPAESSRAFRWKILQNLR